MFQNLKTKYDFLKKTKITNLFHKERFITNIDEEISSYIKDTCKIPMEEKILLVLDDSFFKNLSEIVVFTDKKIYWTIKNASLKIKQNNTEIKTQGHGLVGNQLLRNVSIFSKREKDIKFIFILDETVQLIIPFAHFQTENSLTLSFYDYISNYCGGYKPNNTKNEIIYKKISKTNKIIKINIFARLFNFFSYVAALYLIANVILLHYKYSNIANGKIVCVLIILKLLSIIFGYKKSMYSNLMLFILTYNLLSFPITNHYFDGNIIFLFYAGVIILFSTFDFDKIFRYLAFVLAIISIAYMFAKYFNLEELMRYIS
jgi:hypothetical protein